MFTGTLLGRPLERACQCSCRALCLGGRLGTAWSLELGPPGPGDHHAVLCSDRAKSPGHGSDHRAAVHMAMYTRTEGVFILKLYLKIYKNILPQIYIHLTKICII